MTQSPMKVGTARILIVEDDGDARWLLKHALEMVGHTVGEAATGEEALDELQARPYDVMLLDLNLPDLHGIEILERETQRLPDLITIIITSQPTFESARAALRAGADDYVIKPATTGEILNIIAGRLADRAERYKRLLQLSSTLDQLVGEQTASPVRSENGVLEKQIGEVEGAEPAGLAFDATKREVTFSEDGRERVSLTKGEAALLEVFLDHDEEVLSCEELVLKAWGDELEPIEAESIIRPLIFRLRRKVEDDPRTPRRIRTVRGVGYTFSNK